MLRKTQKLSYEMLKQAKHFPVTKNPMLPAGTYGKVSSVSKSSNISW